MGVSFFRNFVVLSHFLTKAWLADKKFSQSGSKQALADRVGAELRREQERLVDQAAQDPIQKKEPEKRSARHSVAVLEQPETIEEGDDLIYVSKRQDGQIDHKDEFGMFVVRVKKVVAAAVRSNGKGESDPPTVTFKMCLDDEMEMHTVNWDAFYVIPERQHDYYESKTLVLFRRSFHSKVFQKEIVASQLEMGWLKGYYKYRDDKDDPVLVASVDGECMVEQNYVMFDAFGSKRFVNDVEIKLDLLEIEYSTMRSNLPDGDDLQDSDE
jgi:hypothetical protein